MRYEIVEKTQELLPILKGGTERIEKKIKAACKEIDSKDKRWEESTLLAEISCELASMDATCRQIMGAAYRRALEKD